MTILNLIDVCRNSNFARWMLLGCTMLAFQVGCEQNARSLTVNETTAREACTKFLTAWKEGKKIEDLAPIVGNDSDWATGRTLESFEILPEERSDGANLHFKVRRTIKTPKGTVQTNEVSYVVGTSPVVTVFREDQ